MGRARIHPVDAQGLPGGAIPGRGGRGLSRPRRGLAGGLAGGVIALAVTLALALVLVLALAGPGMGLGPGYGIAAARAADPTAATPAPAPADLRPKPSALDLEAVERALRAEEAERARLARQAQATEAELKDLSNRLVAAARRVQDQEDTLNTLEERLARLSADEAAVQAALDRRDAQTIQVLTAVQRLAWRPTEALLVQPASPADTVRVAILLRTAIPRIEEDARALKAELTTLAGLHAAIGAQTALIGTSQDTLRAEHAALRALTEEKQSLIRDLKARGRAAEERMARLSREAQDLRDLLARLEEERLAREARERDEAARLAREQAERLAALAVRDKPDQPAPPPPPPPAAPAAPRPGSPPAPSGGAAPSAATPSAAAPSDGAAPDEGGTAPALASVSPPSVPAAVTFPAAKGRMPFPARGRIIGAYGDRTELGDTLKGLRLATRPEGQVITPHDGTVAFAGPFRSYGNLLIIDHGGGYHTLLAGLGRIDCVVGQRLAAGEPVGVMPADGDQSGSPTLYVELRRKGQPINPRPWLMASKGNASG